VLGGNTTRRRVFLAAERAPDFGKHPCGGVSVDAIECVLVDQAQDRDRDAACEGLADHLAIISQQAYVRLTAGDCSLVLLSHSVSGEKQTGSPSGSDSYNASLSS
jgi:hypothetical protein